MSGKRGGGRIFRPKGRNCLMIAYYGPKKSGEWGEIRESAGTDDEQKAQKRLEARLREVANHRSGLQHFQGPAQERVTVGDLLDALKNDYRNREIKGLRVALVQMKPVREFFGCTRALAVTTDRIRQYIAKRREEGRANATINRETELLGRAFRLGVEEKRIGYAPKVPGLREDNARQGFFEREEIEALLPHLPAPLDDMTRFAYICGWRREEIRVLRWELVDRQAREVRLVTSKNGEGRALPLDETDWQLIEKRWSAREYQRADGATGVSAYVFHRNGKPVDSSTFGKQWRAACETAKLHGKLFHDLRRTAARDMVRGGAPESFAMKITGHKTASMFRRYNIVAPEDMRETLRLRRAHVEGQQTKVRRFKAAAANADTDADTEAGNA